MGTIFLHARLSGKSEVTRAPVRVLPGRHSRLTCTIGMGRPRRESGGLARAALPQPRRGTGQGGHDQERDQAGGENHSGAGGAGFQFAHGAGSLQAENRSRICAGQRLCSCSLKRSQFRRRRVGLAVTGITGAQRMPIQPIPPESGPLPRNRLALVRGRFANEPRPGLTMEFVGSVTQPGAGNCV